MIVIDCEASGLDSESYPIQIGWVNMVTKEEDSFYIHPPPEWDHWCFEAQEIHKIPRTFLSDVGLSPRKAAQRLLSRVPEGPVFCTAPAWDGFWISRLFSEAGIGCPYDAHSVLALVDSGRQAGLILDLSLIDAPHDALEDARIIAEAVSPYIASDPSDAASELLSRSTLNAEVLPGGSQSHYSE